VHQRIFVAALLLLALIVCFFIVTRIDRGRAIPSTAPSHEMPGATQR
jgi:hypothetical protein